MLHQRRCALKNSRGGGFEVVPQSDPTTFGYLPEYVHTDDCASVQRPGSVLPMQKGGGCGCSLQKGGGCGCSLQKGGGCGCSLQKGGGCGCSLQKGGMCTEYGCTFQAGGNKGGFGIDPGMSVGGDGPNTAPVHFAIPCSGQMASQRGGGNGSPLIDDVPFSMTGAGRRRRGTRRNIRRRNAAAGRSSRARVRKQQRGGNHFDTSCYRAPGSEMPVYAAETAGFRFAPSTDANGHLASGVTAYNEVVPYAARLGGGRRTRKGLKKRARGTLSKKKD
jgi:hypothetical protein